jgi:hypothetical protein
MGDTPLMLLHAALVSLVSQTASRCCFQWDSRMKIKPELHFIRHRVVQSFVEGLGTRRDWIPCFIFTTEEVSLAAPILSDLHIVLVEFDPNKAFEACTDSVQLPEQPKLVN